MDGNEKILYFEYVLNKLLTWNSFFTHSVNENDFSILKSLKLLFFVSAAGGNQNRNPLLEEIFDNFVAMPYGHVESDVYDEIKSKNGNLNHFSINNSQTTVLAEYRQPDQLDANLLTSIDNSINNLRNKNEQLVQSSQFDLVNLSHAWYSWQKNYFRANEIGQRSIPIPVEEIILEDKIYSLKPF